MHSWGPSRPGTEPTPHPVWEGLPDLSRVRRQEDDGYLDVYSNEMSQTFIVLSALPSP